MNHSLEDDMKRLAIPSELFSDIVELSWETDKSEKVSTDKSSIFVDNSFVERMKVFKRHNIPVFDVGHIECLYDWR
jgi:hypothetical protein